MAEHITTYTGMHFYPTQPRAEDICIKDIAHALSLICRGNGHVQQFFSVGQHCLNCAREAVARGCGRRIALACLLHDAGECYMSDVPRPFKKTMPDYQLLEEQLLELIYTKYLGSSLTAEEQAVLRQIDDDMLWFDLKYLLNDMPDTPEPKLKIAISYDFVPFNEIEAEYLELFEELK